MSARYRIATVGTATLCLLWAHTAFAWCCDGAPGSQASCGKAKPLTGGTIMRAISGLLAGIALLMPVNRAGAVEYEIDENNGIKA
jgi:hypothetical protein